MSPFREMTQLENKAFTALVEILAVCLVAPSCRENVYIFWGKGKVVVYTNYESL